MARRRYPNRARRGQGDGSARRYRQRDAGRNLERRVVVGDPAKAARGRADAQTSTTILADGLPTDSLGFCAIAEIKRGVRRMSARRRLFDLGAPAFISYLRHSAQPRAEMVLWFRRGWQGTVKSAVTRATCEFSLGR